MHPLTDGERAILREQDADAAYDPLTGPLDEAAMEAEQERARAEYWDELDRQRAVEAFARQAAVNESPRTLADSDGEPF